jgi:hypothetical protein
MSENEPTPSDVWDRLDTGRIEQGLYDVMTTQVAARVKGPTVATRQRTFRDAPICRGIAGREIVSDEDG